MKESNKGTMEALRQRLLAEEAFRDHAPLLQTIQETAASIQDLSRPVRFARVDRITRDGFLGDCQRYVIILLSSLPVDVNEIQEALDLGLDQQRRAENRRMIKRRKMLTGEEIDDGEDEEV
jgi:hypothetical protein